MKGFNLFINKMIDFKIVEKNELLLMAAFSITAVILLSIFFKAYEKKEMQRKGMLFVRRADKGGLMKAYRILMNNPITGSYIRRITSCYEMMYPDMKITAAKKAMYTAAAIGSADLIAFILIFLIKPETSNFITAVIYMYIIHISALSYVSRHVEIKLLTQLDEFISGLKHNYAASNDLLEALWKGIEQNDSYINNHIKKIYEIINSPDLKSRMMEYNESCKIRFLRLLLNISSRIIEQGDAYDLKGEPVFISNMNILKRDIRKEIEKMKRTGFIFSGLTFVIAAPLAALVPIKNWAVTNLAALVQFYDSKNGIYVLFASFIITMAIFHLFENLKEPKKSDERKPVFLYKITEIPAVNSLIKADLSNNQIKKEKQQNMLKRMGYAYGPDIFLLKRLIFAAAGFIMGIMTVVIACRSERNMLITSVYDLYDIIPYGGRQITEEELADIVIKCRGESDEMLYEKLSQYGITNSEIVKNITEKINQKYSAYNDSYVKWHEIVILFSVTVLFYFYPYFYLLYQYQFLEDYMDEEIINFKSILSMQVNLKGISIIELLESMEMFAKVFRPAIQSCINNIFCNEIKALESLKESEPYPPFARLIDCFLLCDKMEPEKAFDEVLDDIKYFQDVYSLDLDIMMKRKSDAAEFLSFLPGTFILLFYLIMPFISAGMSMFEESFKGNLGNVVL